MVITDAILLLLFAVVVIAAVAVNSFLQFILRFDASLVSFRNCKLFLFMVLSFSLDGLWIGDCVLLDDDRSRLFFAVNNTGLFFDLYDSKLHKEALVYFSCVEVS